jgi:hypothetical protein
VLRRKQKIQAMFRNALICWLIPVVEMLTPNESEH